MINETFMLFGEEPGLEDKQACAGRPVNQGVARVLSATARGGAVAPSAWNKAG